MFGHLAVGFASKRLAPRTSLGWFVTAALLLDLVWPLSAWLGLEGPRAPSDFSPPDLHAYPYRHSAEAALIWSLLLAAAHMLATRDWRSAAVLAVGVASHWILGFFGYRPWTTPLEGVLCATAIWSYAAGTQSKDEIGASAFAALVAVLTLGFIGAMVLWTFGTLFSLLAFGAVAGPFLTLPSPSTVQVLALASWLFVPWAFWIDRHREVVASPSRRCRSIPGPGA
jgi:hypothetical protein